jgi:hypothetical protein
VAGMAGNGGGKWQHSWLGVVGRKGNELMSGALESAVGERRGVLAKCATSRRKHNPAIRQLG